MSNNENRIVSITCGERNHFSVYKVFFAEVLTVDWSQQNGAIITISIKSIKPNIISIDLYPKRLSLLGLKAIEKEMSDLWRKFKDIQRSDNCIEV